LHDLIIENVKLLNRRVVVLFDAGRAINKDVLSAEKKQAELYAAAGARVFVAALPLTEAGEDQGPDDFLAKFGAERLRAVMEAARPIEETYPKEEKQAPKKTQAHIIIDLVKESGAPVWVDKQGVFWVTFEVNGHLEHHRLRSEAARRYLRQLSEKASIIPGAQAVQDAIATMEALAPQSEPQTVFVRVGEAPGRIYLDLGSPDWSAVEIDCDGWRIAKVPPVRFKRAKGMLALPIPVKGGELAELRRFLDPIPELDWRFAVSWLLAAMRPKGPYPIAKVNGEQGSGKSTRSRMLRALVDPNACPLRSAPRKEQDLAIAANNGWVVAYDNLSGVSEDLSDALCRVSTGGGFATRALYSDDEETLLDYQRPVLLNGIDEIATREDLADRSIPINLPRIEEENRREESEVWASFEEARPRILGALLDVIVAGLKKLPSIKAKRLPRMADFAKWILACEESLGWEPESFLSAYFGVRTQMSENAIEGDLFSRSIVALVQEKTEWKGTAPELLSALNARLDEAERKIKGWPQDATRTSNKLRRVSPSLRRVGVLVDSEQREGGTGRRLFWIHRCEAGEAKTPPLELRRNEEEKEKRENTTPFRIDLQNSLTTPLSFTTHTAKENSCEASVRLQPHNPSQPHNSLTANTPELQRCEASEASEAKKQTFSTDDLLEQNLNDPGAALNGKIFFEEVI
jgi:hypothetical protein